MTATTACNRCGTPLRATDRFCATCGADVSGVVDAAGETQKTPVPPPASQTSRQQVALLESVRHATLGEYEILAELGRGGMATVYLAQDLALGRKVAIKVMAPALQFQEGMAERFKREARTAASLSHRNIIPIYAVKQAEQVTYFVMKFIEGRSLDSIIKEVGPLPIPMVQAIANQVGSGLGHAHKRGIVHRDVKPANIMVDSDGWAVVTDFGIAKVAESHGLTMTGATVGTPSYMSPEQCAAGELAGASDQYSLGVVIYEMLVGRVLFSGDSAMAVMFAHLHEPPPPITGLRGDVPPELAAAVMRMLEKTPASRWPTVDAAVAALGGGQLAPDDPVRTRLVTLAAAGASSQLMGRISTPVSATPVGRREAGKTGGGRRLSIEPPRVTIALGGAVQFTAKTKAPTGATQPTRGVTWASTDAHVVAVSEEGLATGERVGTATITASLEKASATAVVTVTAADVRRRRAVMWVGGAAIVLALGIVLWLKPWGAGSAASVERTAAPAATVPATPPPTVATESVATPPVSKPVERKAGSLVVSPDRARVEVNRTLALRAVARDADGKVVRRRVEWMSSDPGIASVSTGGVVTGVKPGRATVSASGDGAHSTPVEVEVAAPRPAGRGVLQMIIGPAWAYVSIDGLPRGQRTRGVDTLPAGVHHIRFERNGFAALDTSVTVRPGQAQLLNIELRRSH